MNFIVSIGGKEALPSLGEMLHNKDNIRIESDFQEAIVRENSAGSIFCLGSVKNKDKSKEIETCLDLISEQSLHSVVSELEGRFVLFLVTQNGLYASSDQFGKLDIYYQKNESNITLASNFDLLPLVFFQSIADQK